MMWLIHSGSYLDILVKVFKSVVKMQESKSDYPLWVETQLLQSNFAEMEDNDILEADFYLTLL